MESGFHLVPAAEHLKGTGKGAGFVKNRWELSSPLNLTGLNRQELVACYTGWSSESHSAADINNYLYLCTSRYLCREAYSYITGAEASFSTGT